MTDSPRTLDSTSDPSSTAFDPPDLLEELRRLLAQIPRGAATTCGSIARALGDREAARWVGWALRHDMTDEDVRNLPLHRVVALDGTWFGSPGLPPEAKADRARSEGFSFVAGAALPATAVWADFQATYPLQRLAAEQTRASQQVVIPPDVGRISPPQVEWVGGIDLAYPAAGVAQVGYSVCHWPDGERVVYLAKRFPVRFPYITGYLAYRELPALAGFLDTAAPAAPKPDVLFVDGAGILHPRRLGVAAHLGVVRGIRTIGVTKKSLVVEPPTDLLRGGRQELVVAGERRGWAFLPPGETLRPEYLSPGNGVGVEEAWELAAPIAQQHRLVTPVYWADRASRMPCSADPA